MDYLKKNKSRNNKQTIIVIGCAGCGNIGDNLILEGFQNTLGNVYDIIPACGNYEDIRPFMGERKYIATPFFKGISISILVQMIPFFIKYLGYLIDTESAVVIGGGSLLHGLTKYNLPFYYLITIIAKIFRKPVFFVGIGVGPLKVKSAKGYLFKIMKLADGVFVREQKDYDLLRQIGYDKVQLSADLAFASSRTDRTIISELKLNPKEYAVMTASAWFKSNNFWNYKKMDFTNNKKKLIISVKQLYSIINKEIVFLPTVAYDFQLGQELKAELKDIPFRVLPVELNSVQMSTIVENAYIVYGMRMHSLIMATIKGVPFVATVYDEKVESFLERVNRKDCIIEFDDIDGEKFDEKIQYVLSNYDYLSKELLSKSEYLRKIVVSDMDKIQNEIHKRLSVNTKIKCRYQKK